MKPPFGHRRPAPAFPVKSTGWVGVFLLLLAGSLHASDLPAEITLDLPIQAHQALPEWLGQPEIPSTSFATLNLPILTPDTTSSLLVTVYFQEKQDGFMRIVWKGTQGAQLLSDNFYEGIGMANQRSLLISPATLIGDGILTFQCGDSTLGIARIKLEWLENKSGLVSPAVPDLLVTPAIGPTQSAVTFNGQANPTGLGAWQGQLVTVPLTDGAVRIEQGVDFTVDLDKVPVSARLALKEAGLPMGQHLIVWVNDQPAGTITPTVPDLLDAGFLTDENASISYVGWRDGSYYVPVSMLKAGVNSVAFTEEADAPSTSGNAGASTTPVDAPLAVKGLVLQLNYQAQVQATLPTPQLSPSDSSTSTPNPTP